MGYWTAEVLNTTHTSVYGTNTFLKCKGEDKFFQPTSKVITWKVLSSAD